MHKSFFFFSENKNEVLLLNLIFACKKDNKKQYEIHFFLVLIHTGPAEISSTLSIWYFGALLLSCPFFFGSFIVNKRKNVCQHLSSTSCTVLVNVEHELKECFVHRANSSMENHTAISPKNSPSYIKRSKKTFPRHQETSFPFIRLFYSLSWRVLVNFTHYIAQLCWLYSCTALGTEAKRRRCVSNVQRTETEIVQ